MWLEFLLSVSSLMPYCTYFTSLLHQRGKKVSLSENSLFKKKIKKSIIQYFLEDKVFPPNICYHSGLFYWAFGAVQENTFIQYFKLIILKVASLSPCCNVMFFSTAALFAFKINKGLVKIGFDWCILCWFVIRLNMSEDIKIHLIDKKKNNLAG